MEYNIGIRLDQIDEKQNEQAAVVEVIRRALEKSIPKQYNEALKEFKEEQNK